MGRYFHSLVDPNCIPYPKRNSEVLFFFVVFLELCMNLIIFPQYHEIYVVYSLKRQNNKILLKLFHLIL